MKFLRRNKAGTAFPKVSRAFLGSHVIFPTGHSNTQAFSPVDPLLSTILGISRSQKVLVFAGYYGDWARALSDFSRVSYTDLSMKITARARNKPKGIVSFASRPAELLVRRPLLYDWSFSFEPYPVKGIALVLVRSLLNVKGCKIVWGEGIHTQFIEKAKAVEKLYGAKTSFERIQVQGLKSSFDEKVWVQDKEITGNPFELFTLFTNSESRRKAVLDLKVIRFLQLAERKGKALSDRILMKKFGISKRELQKCRQRISKLAELAQYN